LSEHRGLWRVRKVSAMWTTGGPRKGGLGGEED
jgi:hypothetical protein